MLITRLQVEVKALKDQITSGGLTPNIKFVGQNEEEAKVETTTETNTTAACTHSTEATEELYKQKEIGI